MTERSRFWDSNAVGDAAEAPYDAPTEFSKVVLSSVGADRTTQMSGVLLGILNEYNITVGAGSLTVDTGRAFVWGTWHESDAIESITIVAPTSATRYDRIVLRKDWTLQTVRITKIAGVEGGGVPALEQTIGDKWDLPLGDISTNTAGVSTLVNNEGRLYYPLPNTAFPECFVSRSTDQSIASGGAIVTWQSGTNIKDTIWNAGAPTRLTMRRGGLYHLEVFFKFANFNGFERGITPLVNSEVFVAYQAGGFQSTAAGSTKWNLSCYMEMLKNDYIELHAYQNTGSPLDLDAEVHSQLPFPRARIRFIRPLGVA